MDRTLLPVLQAASQVLDSARLHNRPKGQSVQIFTTFAAENMPAQAGLPLDELATLVAMKLMGVDDHARKSVRP